MLAAVQGLALVQGAGMLHPACAVSAWPTLTAHGAGCRAGLGLQAKDESRGRAQARFALYSDRTGSLQARALLVLLTMRHTVPAAETNKASPCVQPACCLDRRSRH